MEKNTSKWQQFQLVAICLYDIQMSPPIFNLFDSGITIEQFEQEN